MANSIDCNFNVGPVIYYSLALIGFMAFLLAPGRYKPCFRWANVAMRVSNALYDLKPQPQNNWLVLWSVKVYLGSFFMISFSVYYLGGVKGVIAGGNWSPSAGIIGQLTQKGNAKVEELRPAHDFLQWAKLKRRTRSQKIICLQSTWFQIRKLCSGKRSFFNQMRN